MFLPSLAFGLAAFLVSCLATALYHLGTALLAGAFDIAVEEVSLGMGPTLFQKKFARWRFRLALIPLGGCLKFVEDNDRDQACDDDGGWELEREDDVLDQPNENKSDPDQASDTPPATRFQNAPPSAQAMMALCGPLIYLFLGLALLQVSISLGAPQLIATTAGESSVHPCAVSGLDFRNEASSWHGQWQLFHETFLECLRRVVVFESLEGWGGPIGFFVTCGVVGNLSVPGWFACQGVVLVGLGVLNLLPIPCWNGYHVLCAFYQAMTGKQLAENIRKGATCIGLLVVVFYQCRILWADLRWLWGVLLG